MAQSDDRTGVGESILPILKHPDGSTELALNPHDPEHGRYSIRVEVVVVVTDKETGKETRLSTS